MKTMLIVAGALLASTPVLAAPDGAAPFRELGKRIARDYTGYVEAWWEANLDADPKPEYVALICDVTGDEKHGYFIIAKDMTHVWEIAFDVDAHTQACKAKSAEEPKWEQRTAPTITLRQDHNTGYATTQYALRIGQPVIVREETADADQKPTITDWDLLIKKRKEKNYQLPEHVRRINP